MALSLASDWTSGGFTALSAGCPSFPDYFRKASALIRIVSVLRPQIQEPRLLVEHSGFVTHRSEDNETLGTERGSEKE